MELKGHHAAVVPDVLATRYASPEMTAIWSPRGKVVAERRLWIAVLRAQADLGLAVPDGAIEAYEAVVDDVDLDSIMARERVLRHDVKARIEEFCDLAGHQVIHRGMTSRDLTENIEQVQIRDSVDLVLSRSVALASVLAARATEYADLNLTARTHNVAAQVTTFGRRIAMALEELLVARERLVSWRSRCRLRGLKGAVGTQLDLVTLFDGDTARAVELEARVAAELGFVDTLDAPGQVYPRSLDHEVVGALVQMAAGPADFARTLRLMAGHDLAGEGFGAGQVGSSAMPHKMNARSSERIGGLLTVLRGFEAMTAGLVGDQWNEGDVSCSVVRRVALPGAFLAVDGLFETAIVVAADMAPVDAAIAAELDAMLPFLATSRLMLAATEVGLGREEAHELVGSAARATLDDVRGGGSSGTLAQRLGADPRFPLDVEAVAAVIADAADQTGRAREQVRSVTDRVADLVAAAPETASYRPTAIL